MIRKGYHREIDSYSAFFENDHQTPTGLAGYLRERGLTRLFLVGLATDFCVAYSALDARRLGFEVAVIEEGCRGIDLNGSLDAAWKQLEAAGSGGRDPGLRGDCWAVDGWLRQLTCEAQRWIPRQPFTR